MGALKVLKKLEFFWFADEDSIHSFIPMAPNSWSVKLRAVSNNAIARTHLYLSHKSQRQLAALYVREWYKNTTSNTFSLTTHKMKNTTEQYFQ